MYLGNYIRETKLPNKLNKYEATPLFRKHILGDFLEIYLLRNYCLAVSN